MFSLLQLPTEILYSIADFVPQPDILSLMRTCHLLHTIGAKRLYRRIYLCDSYQVTSKVVNVEHLWSVLKMKKEIVEKIFNDSNWQGASFGPEQVLAYSKSTGLVRSYFGKELMKLISTLWSNEEYATYIEGVWFDFDLDNYMQSQFLSLVLENAANLKSIENSPDSSFFSSIVRSKSKLSRLENLTIPIRRTKFSIREPEYFQQIRVVYDTQLIQRLCHLSIFCDAVTLFKRLDIGRSSTNFEKLRLKSLSYYINASQSHIFSETLSPEYFNRMEEIFDPATLEQLTVICSSHLGETDNPSFPESIWGGFDKLKEICFIASCIPVKQIVSFIEETRAKLSKFRFHFDIPQNSIINDKSPIVKALTRHPIQHLDINFQHEDQQFVWFDYISNKVEVSIDKPCLCEDCLSIKKLLLGKYEHLDSDEFEKLNVVRHIYTKGVLPVTLAFDRHPTFVARLGVYWIAREVGLDFTQLNLVYKAMTHHMHSSVRILNKLFPGLSKVVINDIPFVLKGAEILTVFEDPF